MFSLQSAEPERPRMRVRRDLAVRPDAQRLLLDALQAAVQGRRGATVDQAGQTLLEASIDGHPGRHRSRGAVGYQQIGPAVGRRRLAAARRLDLARCGPRWAILPPGGPPSSGAGLRARFRLVPVADAEDALRVARAWPHRQHQIPVRRSAANPPTSASSVPCGTAALVPGSRTYYLDPPYTTWPSGLDHNFGHGRAVCASGRGAGRHPERRLSPELARIRARGGVAALAALDFPGRRRRYHALRQPARVGRRLHRQGARTLRRPDVEVAHRDRSPADSATAATSTYPVPGRRGSTYPSTCGRTISVPTSWCAGCVSSPTSWSNCTPTRRLLAPLATPGRG